MKQIILKLTFGISILVMLSSCGKSKSGIAPDVSDDGVFGPLPVICAKYYDMGTELMKELMAAKDDNTKKEVLTKIKSEEENGDNEFIEACKGMGDIEIPIELSENMPIKITKPFTVNTEKDIEFGEIHFIAEAEHTFDQPDRFAKNFFWYTYPKAVFVDEANHPLMYIRNHNRMQEGQNNQEAGSKFNIEIEVDFKMWNIELLSKAKKIVLFHEKSDTLKAIIKATRERERTYNKKMMDRLSGKADEEGEDGEKE